MGEFIKVAQDLEVKVISDEEPLKEETENNEKETKPRPRQPRTQLSNDTKSNHCPECGTVYSNRSHMLRHYRSEHEGVKYLCNQCDYQATTQSDLKNHIQSKHEGVK